MTKKSDIIVTTPKNKMHVAAEEAHQCIKAGGGFYFRTFRHKPKWLAVGSRIFYIEDGFIRGFGVVSEIVNGNMKCGTTGYDWGEGYHAVMQADSWKWIKPIPMKGFQGWRYFAAKNSRNMACGVMHTYVDQNIKVVGGWLDPKPPILRTR